MSGGKIAAIIVGTVLAVGVVCLLLFCPQYLFMRLIRYRSPDRPSSSGEVPLKDLAPQRPSRASGNERGSNGADDAGSRRRRPEVAHGGITRHHGNNATVIRSLGSPVIINNNIYINSNDYLQPLPALNSPRNRDPVPPVMRPPRHAQGPPGTHSFQFGPQPRDGIPPQRRRRHEPPVSLFRTPTSEQTQTSEFWDVADWARGLAPGQAPPSPARRVAGVSTRESRPNPARRRREGSIRDRAINIPGAFPAFRDAVEGFQLVTAPARARAPGAPAHGDNGFWLRDARESRRRRQEQQDSRERQEREDRRERQEREDRRERERYEREERLERDRLEREDRRERGEREERRERREGEDRREWQGRLRG